MNTIIRLAAVTVTAAGLVLSGTSAHAMAKPPSWCIIAPQGVDGTCTM